MGATKRIIEQEMDKKRAIALNLPPEPEDTKVYDRGELKHWQEEKLLFKENENAKN